jgi:RimJ/RimL family protein N-acetyltransferase
MEEVTPPPGEVLLRDVLEEDLPTFFAQQLDPDANTMAAFTAKNPSDKAAFSTHWAKILADESITIKTILYRADIAGHIACHAWFGDPEVTYWIGKEYWGLGIATASLSQFLATLKARPLYARAAKDNIASIRVLEKCGFAVSGHDRGFATARGEEIDELILKLES